MLFVQIEPDLNKLNIQWFLRIILQSNLVEKGFKITLFLALTRFYNNSPPTYICLNNSPPTYILKQLPTYLYAQTTPQLPNYMLKQLPTYLYAQTNPHLHICSNKSPSTYMLK